MTFNTAANLAIIVLLALLFFVLLIHDDVSRVRRNRNRARREYENRKRQHDRDWYRGAQWKQDTRPWQRKDDDDGA